MSSPSYGHNDPSIDPQAQKAHDEACARQEAGYMDPSTGLFVLTAVYLKNRGQCCGNGCRHCPFDAELQQKAGRRHCRPTQEVVVKDSP